MKGTDEKTPLSWAAWNRHITVVELLLDAGKINIDIKDDKGLTPLLCAAWNRHEAIIKLLLENSKSFVAT